MSTHKLYKFVLFFCSLFIASALYADPLVVVVIMVKNEAPAIQGTLQTYIDAGIKDFIVYDTGSTDGTPDIAREFFNKQSLQNAHIICEEFVDFCTSRNRALDLAEEKYPQATFFLMPDAEWYLRNGAALIKFCSDHQNDPCPSYLIRLTSNDYVLYKSFLIRRDQHDRFRGAVHEWLNTKSQVRMPDAIYVEWRPTDSGKKKSNLRFKRDCELLLKENAKNPNDPRTLFYLAQSYSCMGDWMPAYKYYTERSKLKGDPEEDCATFYRLGVLIEKIGETDKNFTWQMALDRYLTSYSLRPQRVEPLIMIANHYLQTGEAPLCYLFARRACEAPYPDHEFISVERKMYALDRYAILARCAWQAGDFVLGEQAARMVLREQPEDAYTQELWANYKNQLNTAK